MNTERFELPASISKKTLQYFKDYNVYKAESHTSILMPDVGNLPSMDYSVERVSSSLPSNPTEKEACQRTLIQEETLKAKKIVMALNLAIIQASSESKYIKNRMKIKRELEKSLIDGIARESIDLSRNALRDYRKIALYYAAVNLELINV